jgi:Nickel responsive protein SCO4226-like
MTRYLIERVWDPMEEEELSAKGPLSKQLLSENERFAPVVWEHSHTVMDEEGNVKSYCVYSAPDPELIREHAQLLGDHSIVHIYEIGGDISPDDFD